MKESEILNVKQNEVEVNMPEEELKEGGKPVNQQEEEEIQPQLQKDAEKSASK